MIGTRIPVGKGFSQELYKKCADWCNETQKGTITEVDGCYEVVANSLYIPPEESAKRSEIETLRKYLSDTDWMVVKCWERGLSMETEYQEAYAERQRARDRINELE